jgi:hypothetical protein
MENYANAEGINMICKRQIQEIESKDEGTSMIEVLKQMVDVLEYWDVYGGLHQPTEDAIEAGKQAIVVLESQEPVAWVNKERNTITWDKLYPDMDALYATPPQRTWVDLTDDEIALIHADNPHPQGFARAVLAKSKEKNT